MRSAEQHRPLATGEDTAINRCCFSSDIYRLSVNVFGLMAEQKSPQFCYGKITIPFNRGRELWQFVLLYNSFNHFYLCFFVWLSFEPNHIACTRGRYPTFGDEQAYAQKEYEQGYFSASQNITYCFIIGGNVCYIILMVQLYLFISFKDFAHINLRRLLLIFKSQTLQAYNAYNFVHILMEFQYSVNTAATGCFQTVAPLPNCSCNDRTVQRSHSVIQSHKRVIYRRYRFSNDTDRMPISTDLLESHAVRFQCAPCVLTDRDSHQYL